MSRAKQTPVVPLEAGIGPENPPCPACGEPLFGWIDERPGLAGPVMRCESCGLGVVNAPGDTAAALQALDNQASAVPYPAHGGIRNSGTVRIVNRRGFAAWAGGAGWSGLERGVTYLFTAEAARRLVAERDQVVRRVRWAPVAGVAAMWQTILNGFTFGRNVALGALGRSAPVPAEEPWQRRLDAVITAIVCVPVLVVSIPLELVAALFRRGSAQTLQIDLL